MRDRLLHYFQAGFPGIALQTTEEARAIGDVIDAAKKAERTIVTWSATEGVLGIHPEPKPYPDTFDLVPACKTRIENAVYIFRDVQTWPFDRDPVLARGLRDLLAWGPSQGSTVVFIGPNFQPHATFEKLVTVLDFTLPDRESLIQIANGIAEGSKKKITATDPVLRALGGLSTTEAENALALSVVETKDFSPTVIYREKVQAVKRSGLLEIVDPDPRGLGAIGGLEELKAWIVKRRRAYTPEAEKFGLPSPKGVLLVGVPGTGKSLSAKAFGTALEVPTVRLDIGSLFNSLVGESEARTRDALKLTEAMAPCVLWIDEIDKGLAGSSGTGSGDSGVTRRVFGTVISWMQERRRPVFLVATANQVEGLPPELLRKGRFDEIFAIDLPTVEERATIFAIHVKRAGRDPEKIDCLKAAKETELFTGSEIETVIHEALFNAFDEGRDIVTTDLIQAARAIVPLATTAKEQIEAIRAWAKTRARFASRTTVQPATQTGTRRLG